MLQILGLDSDILAMVSLSLPIPICSSKEPQKAFHSTFNIYNEEYNRILIYKMG